MKKISNECVGKTEKRVEHIFASYIQVRGNLDLTYPEERWATDNGFGGNNEGREEESEETIEIPG